MNTNLEYYKFFYYVGKLHSITLAAEELNLSLIHILVSPPGKPGSMDWCRCTTYDFLSCLEEPEKETAPQSGCIKSRTCNAAAAEKKPHPLNHQRMGLLLIYESSS